MERRMRRHGTQVSPERSKVWTEPSPKHQMQKQLGRKVPVVYYLCKNRHLEHPHFIEVPLSSPEGLYLKDVMSRLVVLRGRRMPAIYAWSCKRSYKNGFVWQDLSEDDLILPVHGNEYILKGSELLDQTPPGRLESSSNPSRLQNPASSQQETSTSCRIVEGSSPYSSPVCTSRDGKSPSSPPAPIPVPSHQEDDTTLPLHQLPSPDIGSPNYGQCRIFMLGGAQDASTQTEDGRRRRVHEPSSRSSGMSTNDGLADVKYNEIKHNWGGQFNEGNKKVNSPSQTQSSVSSGGRIDTLESLIKSEVNKFNSFRIIEEEEVVPMKTKIRRTNVLLQLLTCGSTLVKDHQSLGFIPTYKPMFCNTRLSPMYPSSVVVRDVDYMSDSSRVMRMEPEQRGSFRSLAKNSIVHKDRGEALPRFNCSSFYDEEMSCKSPGADPKGNMDKVADHVGSSNLYPTIQNMSNIPATNATFKSSILDARSSFAQNVCCKSPSVIPTSDGKRITDINTSKGSSMGVESHVQEDEGTVQIEESYVHHIFPSLLSFYRSLLQELVLSLSREFHMMITNMVRVLERKLCFWIIYLCCIFFSAQQ